MPAAALPQLQTLLAQLQAMPERVTLPAHITGRRGLRGWLIAALSVAGALLYPDPRLFIALSALLLLALAWSGLLPLWAALVLLALLAVAWLAYRHHKTRSTVKGWVIDFAARTLAGQSGAAQTLALQPAQDWSLGALALPADDGSQTVRLELRHARSGPVAELVKLRFWQGRDDHALQDIDALADTLAQRLGVRRSGSRLAPESLN